MTDVPRNTANLSALGDVRAVVAGRFETETFTLGDVYVWLSSKHDRPAVRMALKHMVEQRELHFNGSLFGRQPPKAKRRLTVLYTYKLKRREDGEWEGPFTVVLNPTDAQLKTAVFWSWRAADLASGNMDAVGVEIVGMEEQG